MSCIKNTQTATTVDRHRCPKTYSIALHWFVVSLLGCTHWRCMPSMSFYFRCLKRRAYGHFMKIMCVWTYIIVHSVAVSTLTTHCTHHTVQCAYVTGSEYPFACVCICIIFGWTFGNRYGVEFQFANMKHHAFLRRKTCFSLFYYNCFCLVFFRVYMDMCMRYCRYFPLHLIYIIEKKEEIVATVAFFWVCNIILCYNSFSYSLLLSLSLSHFASVGSVQFFVVSNIVNVMRCKCTYVRA